jgi:pilus assembly protein CpaB
VRHPQGLLARPRAVDSPDGHGCAFLTSGRGLPDFTCCRSQPHEAASASLAELPSRRLLAWRKLAVLAVLAAVLTGISAAAPDGPPKTTVVRTATQLPGGTRLSSADLEIDEVVIDDAPEGAVNDPADLVGRTLAAPAAKGQIMTEFATSARDPTGRGHVLAPLRLADPEVVALLRAGDVVDVLAADPQSEQAYVAGRAVRVVTVPQPPDSTGNADSAGALVLVEVDQETARVLARAAVAATLTVIWR